MAESPSSTAVILSDALTTIPAMAIITIILVRFPNLYFGSIQYSWGTWLVVGDPPFLPPSFYLLFIRLCLTGTWRRGEKKRFYENQRQNVRDFENSYQRRKNITKRDKKRKSEDLMWTKHAVCQKLFWINHVHLKDRIHSRQIYFQIYVIIITLE